MCWITIIDVYQAFSWLIRPTSVGVKGISGEGIDILSISISKVSKGGGNSDLRVPRVVCLGVSRVVYLGVSKAS